MLDTTLSWLVLVIPVALGLILIVVPAKHEDPEAHMRWRYILGGVLILYGGLAWWQQVRATNAAERDRESAIKQTSKEVAAETSKEVTKAVTEQYSQMISEQKGQISDLQKQLSSQGKDVTAIKSSNIVTGKNPVKVEVINPNSSGGKDTQLPSINWTQQQTRPTEGKPTVMIDFMVDAPLDLPAFIAVCDRTCIAVGAGCLGASQATYLNSTSPLVAGAIFSTPRPLSARLACELTVASVDNMPIKIVAFRILKESEVPPELK